MTAALDPSAARRKSFRAATASRQKGSAPQSAQNRAAQESAKVVPLRQAATEKESIASLEEAIHTAKETKKRDLPRSSLRETIKQSTRQSTGQSTRQSTVRTLPQPQPLPFWLKGLFALQQGSMLITLMLVAAGLGVYGWTVYTQQRWSDAYQRLENLQKRERQFLTTNEVLKNQMAEQAEKPGVGLVPPDPNSTIFLSPAPLRPAAAPEVAPSPDTPIPARPLGY